MAEQTQGSPPAPSMQPTSPSQTGPSIPPPIAKVPMAPARSTSRMTPKGPNEATEEVVVDLGRYRPGSTVVITLSHSERRTRTELFKFMVMTGLMGIIILLTALLVIEVLDFME